MFHEQGNKLKEKQYFPVNVYSVYSKIKNKQLPPVICKISFVSKWKKNPLTKPSLVRGKSIHHLSDKCTKQNKSDIEQWPSS